MKQTMLSAMVLGSLLSSIPALAQPMAPTFPVGDEPGLAAPAPRYRLGPSMQETYHLQQVLRSDPQYLHAKSRRNSGIVLTAVGVGVGMLTASIAVGIARVEEADCRGTCDNDNTTLAVVGLTGLGVAIVSAAVGVPMIVSGAREMRYVRNRHLGLLPQPSVAVGPGHAAVSGTWRF